MISKKSVTRFFFNLRKVRNTFFTVRYRAIFTQVFEPGLATAVRHIPGGTYLCVAFRWSTAHYLTYLQQLVQAYQQLNLPGTPPVYEVSLADGYNYQNDQDFLTELRVKL